MKLNRKLLSLTLALPAICLAGGPDHYQHHDDSGMYVGIASGAAFTKSTGTSGDLFESDQLTNVSRMLLKTTKTRIDVPLFMTLGYQIDNYFSVGVTYNHVDTTYKSGWQNVIINNLSRQARLSSKIDLDSGFVDANYRIPMGSMLALAVGGGIGVVHMTNYDLNIPLSDGAQLMDVSNSDYALGFFGDVRLVLKDVVSHLSPFVGFQYMNYGKHTLTKQYSSKFNQFTNVNLSSRPKAWLYSLNALVGVNYMFSM